jgi:hypothetical protein
MGCWSSITIVLAFNSPNAAIWLPKGTSFISIASLESNGWGYIYWVICKTLSRPHYTHLIHIWVDRKFNLKLECKLITVHQSFDKCSFQRISSHYWIHPFMPQYSFLTPFQLLLLNTYPYFAISEFKKREFIDKITQDFIPKKCLS